MVVSTNLGLGRRPQGRNPIRATGPETDGGGWGHQLPHLEALPHDPLQGPHQLHLDHLHLGDPPVGGLKAVQVGAVVHVGGAGLVGD